ncbi:MAG: cyclase [Pseudobdellovibrio sp.]|jgi:uncharacterized membrane protein|nr:cyclase [Pseudobdellovibrio sp.]
MNNQYRNLNQQNAVHAKNKRPLPYGRTYHSDDVSRFAVTIGKPIEEVFNFWRNFQNLSFFMKDLKEVEVLSPTLTRWVMELKNGVKATWDAEVTAERKNEMISWKSLPGSEVETDGSVWFSPAPQGKGCVVSLVMNYSAPGGKVTEFITKLTGEDGDTLMQVNLRRLKAFLETGEIPTTEGQPNGREVIPELKH